ncbi:MAG: hypothetical protein ACRD0Q_04080 [Acidimicrobiales bacterium]
MVASLPPEQRPVADQILRGGIPAVRQAVEEQNAKAKTDGSPQIHPEGLLAMAEELLPRLRAAEWRDRAEAAVDLADDVSLRDLRAIVAGSGAGRDEESRKLAVRLREILEARTAAERKTWLDEIMAAIADGRVVRALRLSSRPPEPGSRFPADVAARLGEAAGTALGPESSPERWTAVLEAVVASPVRRTVQPRSLPDGADEKLLQTARATLQQVPGLAALVPPAALQRPPKPEPVVKAEPEAAAAPKPEPTARSGPAAVLR